MPAAPPEPTSLRTAHREFSDVVVTGPIRLAVPIAEAIRRLGVGRVLVPASKAPLMPHLVVLASTDAPDRLGAADWLARGIEHLPVVVGPRSLVVGPLVAPGRTPCLMCAPSDAAPGQVGGTAPTDDQPRAGEAEIALAAATVAMLVAAALNGCCPHGVTLEAVPPWPRWEQRRWVPDPLCTCGAGRSSRDRQAILAAPTHLRAAAG